MCTAKKISPILLILWMIIPALAFADGFIIIDPPKVAPPQMPYEPMRLNIKYHHVDVEIDNQVATTKVDQVFENPYRQDLEGTYIFPIPDGANISKFSMFVDGKELQGKILDRDEARKVYDSIVRQQKDPALLEYMDRAMFQARVYPIPARGEKRIKLEYSEVLTADNGTAKYHYTLNTEKFSATPLDDVSVKVDIKSAQSIVNVYSPTHDIDVDQISETRVKAEYFDERVRPDRDFILYYTVSNDEVGFNLLTYNDSKEDGFFMLMVSPNNAKIRQKILPKNMVFILDTSGSMSGEKISQAKSALEFCVNQLNPEDRFSIISFNTEIEFYQRRLVDANSSNRRSALNFVDRLNADGGTNINDALKEGLSVLQRSDRPNMIIFLTDGLPTVGEQEIGQIIKNVTRANTVDARLFVFGVGYDVNTQLLDKLSLDNGGSPEYVAPEESIEAKVSNLFAKVSNPVLTDVKLKIDGVRISDMYPKQLPDVFKGSQLIIAGRYTGSGGAAITLSGKQAGQPKTYTFVTDFARRNTRNDYLPRIWAGRKIAYLVDQIVLNGEDRELVDEIVKLSKKYGIITEYTSFLVDEDAPRFSEYESDEAYGNAMRNETYQMLDAAEQEQTGKGAVGRAKSQQDMRSMQSAPTAAPMPALEEKMGAEKAEKAAQSVKQVKARTFYQQDGIWVDSDHNASAEVIQIKPFSQAYFDLLDQRPDLKEYLAVGDQVIINLGAISVQIDEKGQETLKPAQLQKLQAKN